MNKLEQAARQIIVDWDSGIHLYEAITALREALAKPCVNGCDTSNGRCVDCPDSVSEQAEQEPIRFVWNGEGWIEADEYIWKTTDDHERRILYATPQPDMNLNCKSVQKRLATVWGYVKAEQTEQEPYAYEVWDANDQVLILIYASCLKEFYWIEQDDIARKLYASPVRIKDLTDDEVDALIDEACDSQMPYDMFARAVIQEYRRKNGIV